MQIGFEFTAAVPKRLRAAEEQPAQQSMRGDRKITQAPSTDQKRVRREMARKTASAGDVAEHDNVQAKDEFDPAHIEPGGGHHHHKPRTAMNPYLALMNDVGDCRSCGGNLVRDPAQKGDSTVTAHCSDCGMEHQLQDTGQRTGSIRLTARQQHTLNVIALIHEVEDSACPDCGSKGWGTKSGGGHSQQSGGGEPSTFHWHARCLDCGHHYEVGRHDDAYEHGVRRARYSSLAWLPVTSKYLPDPHQHKSAIARRAQSVLDTEEIQ